MTLEGGNDDVSGPGGDDRPDTGAGDDVLAGGSGGDTLTGGPGADTFVFAPQTGTDTITDFEAGVDTLEIDEPDNPAPFLTPELITGFATVGSGETVFDFFTFGTLVLTGEYDLVQLRDDILIT